jgi:hypothetical protein
MTHDKLLARIESKQQDYYADDQSLNALRAVVKLITKEDTIPLDDYHFGYMAACKDIYEAIEKELG